MGNSNKTIFSVKDVHVKIEGQEVVKGVSLEIRKGEKHALMGLNGSGKSSLANALAGHPNYEITSGEVYLDGENLLDMNPTERSRAGLFLAFQYPLAIPGVTVANFMRSAIKSHSGNNEELLRGFRKDLKDKFKLLRMDDKFATRYVNDGFSGGEKKRLEILQMAMLQPKMAILDETDSGLDIDALKIVSEGINASASKEDGVLLVTHYQRLLDYVKPDFVHVMMDGKIVKSGSPELARKLEDQGYDWLKAEKAGKVGV
ncbi:MAG: Fe-S cluster assembly ATPase SufC [candidate division Zixibacteria bacterium]|nr:Fe-S cluster assembly ATPase SufC [candidate division Zixibacteria bacterium]